MKKSQLISTANIAFSVVLLIGVSLTILSYVWAAAPNPGHNFNTVGGGTVQGDLLYGSAADTLSALAKDTNASRYLSNTGASNNPAWAQVNLTNGVSGVLSWPNGGTNNAFMTFTGPATDLKTFTLPNATSTILTDFADVTVAQGGTGTSSLILNNVILGNGASTVNFVAPGTAGNILQSDGTTWSSASGGVIIGRQTLTSGTSYTPTGGTTKIWIRIWGGGGAGGGCSAAAGCAGGGGGSGSYAEYYLTNATSGPYTIIIGAGGAGASGAIGGNGASSTFVVGGGTTVLAPGGFGGTFTAGTAAIKFMAGGAGGGTSTSGHVNAAGAPGGPGMTSTTATVNMSGAGGATSLGGAGVSKTSATGVVGAPGLANTGSGGSGAAAGTATANAGGNGGSGVIIVTEYR